MEMGCVRKEEKSVRECPSRILYRATLHLSQSARAQNEAYWFISQKSAWRLPIYQAGS
jgi:hypothetical protein